MKAKALVFAGCAVFALGGTAQAGPCAEQIDSLTKAFCLERRRHRPDIRRGFNKNHQQPGRPATSDGRHE